MQTRTERRAIETRCQRNIDNSLPPDYWDEEERCWCGGEMRQLETGEYCCCDCGEVIDLEDLEL